MWPLPRLAARNMGGIRKAEYHEIGATGCGAPIPFAVRLVGNIAIPGGGYRDLAHLANCSPGGTGPYVTSPACSGKDPALFAEARFRALLSRCSKVFVHVVNGVMMREAKAW